MDDGRMDNGQMDDERMDDERMDDGQMDDGWMDDGRWKDRREGWNIYVDETRKLLCTVWRCLDLSAILLLIA